MRARLFAAPVGDTHLIHHLNLLLGRYGDGLVGIIIALEAMGLPLPGESLLIAAAIYCATTHKLSIVWMLVSAAFGAIMGDNAGYLIGRLVGYRVLARHGRRIGLTEDRLLLGRHLFRRFGAPVVLIGRFVAILRTFVALLAGANHMRWSRFLLWNTIGGCLWAGGYGMTAYLAGDRIRHIAGPFGIALACVIAVAAVSAIYFLKHNERRLIVQARLEEQGESKKPR